MWADDNWNRGNLIPQALDEALGQRRRQGQTLGCGCGCGDRLARHTSRRRRGWSQPSGSLSNSMCVLQLMISSVSMLVNEGGQMRWKGGQVRDGETVLPVDYIRFDLSCVSESRSGSDARSVRIGMWLKQLSRKTGWYLDMDGRIYIFIVVTTVSSQGGWVTEISVRNCNSNLNHCWVFVKIWQDQSASFEEMEGRGRSYSISGCRKLMQSLKKWELYKCKATWISSIRKSLLFYSVMFVVTKCQQRRTNLRVRGDIVVLILPLRYMKTFSLQEQFCVEKVFCLSTWPVGCFVFFFRPNALRHPAIGSSIRNALFQVTCDSQVMPDLRNPCQPIRFKCWIINWPTFGSSSAPE